jgi:long-chain acyl-CoA synthetase
MATEIVDATALDTLPRHFSRTVAERGNQVALRWPVDGAWISWTWAELADQARRVAAGLCELGVRKGDRVLLMMRNRAEFHACEMGAQLLGAIPVAIFNSSSPEQVAYFARHSGAVVAIVGGSDLLDRVLSGRRQEPELRDVVSLDDEPAAKDGLVSYADLTQHGAVGLIESLDNTTPDSLATVIYTSGTTGDPKGVKLSHRNVCATIEGFRRAAGTSMAGWRIISYMPMAHVSERSLTYWLHLAHGSEVSICSDPRSLNAMLVQVRPHFFGAVPRIWEKLHAGLTAAVAAQNAESRQAFVDALGTGLEAGRSRLAGTMPVDLQRRWLGAREVLEPYLAMVGLDECRMALTGAAPTSNEVFDFFLGLGVPMGESFACSEALFVAGYSPTNIKPGWAGKPLPGMEVKLLEDGELLVRGASVFSGYLDDPERTSEVLDGDGWYHTGDIATIDDDGFIGIIDRKRELIITATGENVSPASIEGRLKACAMIDQACVVGDHKPYITALVTLSSEGLDTFTRTHGINDVGGDDLAADQRIRAEVEREILEVNRRLSAVEQVKRFVIIRGAWLADSAELTPSLKLKRRVIVAKYAAEIAAMYS